MEDAEDKVNINSTRSFGQEVYSKRELQEAIATFCTKAAEKLRGQESVCYHLSVFVHTNYFKDAEQYYGVGSYRFQNGTSDTMKLIKGAYHVLESIYKRGLAYKKGGAILSQIVPKSQCQLDLFNPDPMDNEQLSQVIDRINKRFGPRTIKSLACGIDHSWKLVSNHRSKNFTTEWDEVLVV